MKLLLRIQPLQTGYREIPLHVANETNILDFCDLLILTVFPRFSDDAADDEGHQTGRRFLLPRARSSADHKRPDFRLRRLLRGPQCAKRAFYYQQQRPGRFRAAAFEPREGGGVYGEGIERPAGTGRGRRARRGVRVANGGKAGERSASGRSFFLPNLRILHSRGEEGGTQGWSTASR